MLCLGFKLVPKFAVVRSANHFPVWAKKIGDVRTRIQLEKDSREKSHVITFETFPLNITTKRFYPKILTVEIIYNLNV